MRCAIQLLQQFGHIVSASHVWKTRPINCTRGDDFYNVVVVLESFASVLEWKSQIIPRIEKTLQRVRDANDKCAPRTIDLDIVDSLHDAERLPFVHQLLAESRGEHPTPQKEMAQIAPRELVISGWPEIHSKAAPNPEDEQQEST